MKAGTFDRRIEIQKPVEVKQPTGERLTSYEQFAITWAGKQSLLFKEIARQQGTTTQAESKFVIRYREDLNTKMRVVFEGRAYEITAIEEIGRREGQTLYVRSVANDG